MAKLTKDLPGVVDGDVYPTVIASGSECPPELVEAAIALGALPASTKVPKKVVPAAPADTVAADMTAGDPGDDTLSGAR